MLSNGVGIATQWQHERCCDSQKRSSMKMGIISSWLCIFSLIALVSNQLFRSPDRIHGEITTFTDDATTAEKQQQQPQQRKVFHNLLTLPNTFVARRDTNRGQLPALQETVVHDIVGQQGCLRTLSLTMMTSEQRRPQTTCTTMDVFDFVVLRMYVDNETQPSVEVVVNHLFGIHHSKVLKDRRPVSNYMYSISANGAMVFKIPAPYQHGLKITMTNPSHPNHKIINFWSFLDYEEYPMTTVDGGRNQLEEPLRLKVREGVLDSASNQLLMAEAYNQRGYLVGFTMGAGISENSTNGVRVDWWFHNGGEMLVLDQRDPVRASLMHGVGAEDAFYESCNPRTQATMTSDMYGFQYALDKDHNGISNALDPVRYVSGYRAFLEHDVIPFEHSFALHMGKTEHYDFSSVVYWYGTQPTHSSVEPLPSSSSSSSSLVVEKWNVCGQQPFEQNQYFQSNYSQTLEQYPMNKENCKEIHTGNREFLDLTYAMILSGEMTNAKLKVNQRVSVYATIPYERMKAILSLSPYSSTRMQGCIQLEVFHDDFTLVWLAGDLVYLGMTRRGHGLSLSDPFRPTVGVDVEMAILMANTENNNFRAWLLGVTARPVNCNEKKRFSGEGLPLVLKQ